MTNNLQVHNYNFNNGRDRLGTIIEGCYETLHNKNQSSVYNQKVNHKQFNDSVQHNIKAKGFSLNKIKFKPNASVCINLQTNVNSRDYSKCSLIPSQQLGSYPQLELSKHGEMDKPNVLHCCITNHSDASVELDSETEICDLLMEDSYYDCNPRLPDDWLSSSSVITNNLDLVTLLNDYKKTINTCKPTIKLPMVHIETQPDISPIYSNPYRVSDHKQKIIDDQIN